MLKIWHYLNYEGHFYLCVQRKTNAFLEVYVPFWKFQEVSQSCNMLKPYMCVERCGSVSPVCRYVLTIISVKSLHKSDETSLTVTRINVSLTPGLTLKWEVALICPPNPKRLTTDENYYFWLKARRNWSTLLAKHWCFHLKLGVTFLPIAYDLEANNSLCQAMLASFAKA